MPLYVPFADVCIRYVVKLGNGNVRLWATYHFDDVKRLANENLGQPEVL